MRRDSVVTLLTLGYALHGCGRLDEARRAWQSVLRLDPSNAEAKQRLNVPATTSPSPVPISGATGSADQAFSLCKTALRTDKGSVDVMFAARGPVDEAIVRDVCERDIYRLVEVKTAPATILDVGAHIGCFSALAAHRWPNARIVACEPDLANYVLLDRHLKPCLTRGQIEVVNKAVLGDDVSETDFWAVADKAHQNSGGGSCCRQEPGSARVRTQAISIEQLWREQGLTTCDLLKLDCEGAEYSILEGLKKAQLLPHVGRIVGEWHCGFGRMSSPQDAEAELQRILSPTHRLSVELKEGSHEGHFVAERL